MESNSEVRQDSPHFGAALQELEAIVDRLEGHPDLNLEEALEQYERGAALADHCRTLHLGGDPARQPGSQWRAMARRLTPS